MGTLQRRFGYANVSIYLMQDDGQLHLGAHRGYQTISESFDESTGIVGRAMRTRTVALVGDTAKIRTASAPTGTFVARSACL